MNVVETLTELVINKRLADLYGNHVAVDRPRFKVCFSDDQLEKRLVLEELRSDILVPVNEIRTMPKYPWLYGQWLVERLIPNPYKDVMEGDYVYECLYAFPENLPLNWEAVYLVTSYIMNPPKSIVPKNQKDADYQEKEHLDKEKEFTKNMLDVTPLETSLNDGSAEFYSGAVNYKPSEQDGKLNEYGDGSK